RVRPARERGRVPGRARSAYARRAGMAARLAPQARCGALAGVPPLACPRREAAAHARRGGRARHRDLADLHSRAGRLPRGADPARQGLRIRRRGGDAFQHEEPDERLRPLRARRPGRPAAAGVRRLGQQIVVENRPGASGMLGLDLVAKSAPDGYTLAAAQGGNMVVLPHTSRNIPYDPLKDFVPIAVSTTNYLGIVANPAAPFKSI